MYLDVYNYIFIKKERNKVKGQLYFLKIRKLNK